MKKLVILLALLVFATGLFAQEAHRTVQLARYSDGATAWILSSTTVDTSKIFALYQDMTWKGFFNDTSDVSNDSCFYIVKLFTSSMALTTIDSTFTLAQTIFNAPNEFDGDSLSIAFWGGPTRPKPVFPSAERFGYVTIQGLAKFGVLDSAVIGGMYINGWTNQTGARLSRIGR